MEEDEGLVSIPEAMAGGGGMLEATLTFLLLAGVSVVVGLLGFAVCWLAFG